MMDFDSPDFVLTLSYYTLDLLHPTWYSHLDNGQVCNSWRISRKSCEFCWLTATLVLLTFVSNIRKVREILDGGRTA